MGVDWGNALAGAGVGLLGGYSQMLGMKMKEDFDLKMEEVKGERQMNLQKQSQDYMKPYHDADAKARERQLTITEDHYRNTEANQKLQIKQSAAAQAQSARYAHEERAANAAHRTKMEQLAEARQKYLEDPQRITDQVVATYKGQTEIQRIESEQLYNSTLEKTKDPIQASLAVTAFKDSGAKTRDEYNKAVVAGHFKSIDDISAFIKKPVEEEWTKISELYSTKDGKNELIERAQKEVAGTGIVVKGAEMARDIVKQNVLSTNYNVAKSLFNTGTQTPSPSPDKTSNSGMKVDDIVNTYAEGISTYNSLASKTPEQNRKYDELRSSFSKLPETVQLEISERISSPSISNVEKDPMQALADSRNEERKLSSQQERARKSKAALENTRKLLGL